MKLTNNNHISETLQDNLKLMFRALKYKNYRLFVSGQSVSLIGTWIQMVSMLWLVYSITNSALILGVVGFSGQIPMFVIAPFAGALADRVNKHKFILVTQILALAQAFVLSVLVLFNLVSVWHLIVLSVILGVINALDMPVRQSFVIEMIDNNKEDIGNAIALNSSMVNAARLVGPSIAGILIATVGEGWCFFLNSLSYLAVVTSLLKMKITPVVHKAEDKKILKDISEGFKYSFGFPPIKYLISQLAVIGLFSSTITLLAPVVSKEMLHGNSSTFGFLMSAFGSGALMGAVYLLNKKTVLGLGKLIAGAATLFGLSLILFSISHIFIFSVIIMLFAGLSNMLIIASTNTLLQTIVEEDKRGRVMSLYTMAFRGMSPFGNLLAGGLAGFIGTEFALASGGIVSLISGLLFLSRLPYLRNFIHPIYAKLGIIDEVATGVQQASSLSSPPSN
jgi:MFS family permease